MANLEAPFEVWVGNLRAYTEGKQIGKWVSFPQSNEALKKIERDIAGVNNDDLIIMDISVRKDCAYLTDIIGEWEHLSDLNAIAQLIGKELHPAVIAYLEHVEKVSVPELANLLMQEDRIPYYTYTFSGSDNPEVMENLNDEERLGYEMLEKDTGMLRMLEAFPLGTSNVLNYIDVEAIGRDLSQNQYYSPDRNGYYNLTVNALDLEYYTMEEIQEHLTEQETLHETVKKEDIKEIQRREQKRTLEISAPSL